MSSKESIELIEKFICIDCDTNRYCKNCEIRKAIDTIKALIDRQGDYMSYQDLKAEYEKQIQELKEAYEQQSNQRIQV